MSAKSRILIVDDEPSSVRLLERVLSSLYDIRSASSGKAALELIPGFRPDLMLLDIDMPEMDGYEICRRLRADKNYNLLKILLVSGHSRLEERLKGYEVGADDYVAKPFDNNELRAKIEVFMKLKRVEEIDNIKSDLLTLFSHETRTPLGGIIGISELMATDDSLSEDVREKASLIYESSVQLFKFIEKATLLSKIKSGMELNRDVDSLRRHLDAIIADRKADAETKAVTITLDCPNDISLNADWKTLDEVLGYIIENAVKFTGNNSCVKTAASLADDICTIKITDQGDGIDPDTTDSIFDEFSIQDIMHHQKGQGLSLAIAKQIIELHSGQISVDSLPGQGATFILEVPASTEKPTHNAG